MKRKVRTAVLPVAGLGTRLLPATAALPKEMLVVVDRPVIDYVVEEARAAGIERFVFVTGRNKDVIEDHFDRQSELEDALARKGKTAEIDMLRARRLPPGAAIFTRQQAPAGLGHAIWCARHIVGDEPFAVLLPDVIIDAPGKGCLSELVDAYGVVGTSVVAVEEVAPAETSSYGVVGIDRDSIGSIKRITSMVEKPAPGLAPSNLILTGRYVLDPAIFDVLGATPRGAGGEIQLTDAMCQLLEQQDLFALQHRGRTFDCGSKAGLLAANIAYGLARKDLASGITEQLRELLPAVAPDLLRQALAAMHGVPLGNPKRAA